MSNDLPPSTAMPAEGASSGVAPEINQALVALCSAVLPIWGRHLATSRTQSEVAVSEMISAFAAIGPHLHKASRQSHQITAALAQGDGGITQLAQACENELLPLLPKLDADAASAVQRVMVMVRQSVEALEQIASPFEHETQMVSQEVDRMYVGFQYQDRISQMISLLHDDIQRLQGVMLAPGDDVEALAQNTWLARLESQYAMAEQRQDHVAAAPFVNTPAVSGDDEIDFF